MMDQTIAKITQCCSLKMVSHLSVRKGKGCQYLSRKESFHEVVSLDVCVKTIGSTGGAGRSTCCCKIQTGWSTSLSDWANVILSTDSAKRWWIPLSKLKRVEIEPLLKITERDRCISTRKKPKTTLTLRTRIKLSSFINPSGTCQNHLKIEISELCKIYRYNNFLIKMAD